METIKTAGLNIFIDTRPVHQGLAWSSLNESGVWFGSLLKGKVAVEHATVGDHEWRAGVATWFRAEASTETRHLCLEDGDITGVFVRISLDDIEDIAGPEGLMAVAAGYEGGKAQAIILPPQATAVIQAIGWQMVGCPLTGASRRLYLGGKAMEMIAHLLSGDAAGATRQTAAGQRASRAWTPRDVECFHHARAILLSRLRDPPSVPELARTVGVNARKLSEGFVDLFGEPVYGFVKTRRLEGARLMIEAGESSIARVANAFGYQPGHLATAFRKRFGVSPTMLTGRRPTVDLPSS